MSVTTFEVTSLCQHRNVHSITKPPEDRMRQSKICTKYQMPYLLLTLYHLM